MAANRAGAKPAHLLANRLLRLHPLADDPVVNRRSRCDAGPSRRPPCYRGGRTRRRGRESSEPVCPLAIPASVDGALMEQSGRKRGRPSANRAAAKVAQTSRIRCPRLQIVATHNEMLRGSTVRVRQRALQRVGNRRVVTLNALTATE